jgi:hypothetical protein
MTGEQKAAKYKVVSTVVLTVLIASALFMVINNSKQRNSQLNGMMYDV